MRRRFPVFCSCSYCSHVRQVTRDRLPYRVAQFHINLPISETNCPGGAGAGRHVETASSLRIESKLNSRFERSKLRRLRAWDRAHWRRGPAWRFDWRMTDAQARSDTHFPIAIAAFVISVASGVFANVPGRSSGDHKLSDVGPEIHNRDGSVTRLSHTSRHHEVREELGV